FEQPSARVQHARLDHELVTSRTPGGGAQSSATSPCYLVAMPTYRIGQAAELLGVSPDTVRRWADAGRVKTTITDGGWRSFDGEELARFATEIAGDQTLDRPRKQSARNRFLGIIT